MIEIPINILCKDVGGLWETQNPLARKRWIKVHHCIVVLREHLNKKKKMTKERHIEFGLTRID